MRALLGLLALCGLPAAGQIRGPEAGYVFDAEAHQVRPVRGIVGTGAYVAEGVLEAEAASVSPDGALVAVIRQGAVEIVRGFGTEDAVVRRAADAPGGRLWFAWAGRSLALVAATNRQALVWQDAGEPAQPARTWDLGTVAGEVRAVCFDGAHLALASSAGLYLATAEGVRRVLEFTDAAALVRLGQDLFVLDRGRAEIWQILDYAGLAAPVWFARVEEAAGMAAVRGALLVATREPRAVLRIDLDSRSVVETLPLDFTPSRLEPLGSGGLAMLNSPSASEPLYVLDAHTALAVSFVPAGRKP